MLDIISQPLSDVHDVHDVHDVRTPPFLSSSSFLSTGSRQVGEMDILRAVGRREEIDRLHMREVKSWRIEVYVFSLISGFSRCTFGVKIEAALRWTEIIASSIVNLADTSRQPRARELRLEGIIFNPTTPEVNPLAQRCLMRFFTGDFASWTVHLVNICVKNQQMQQLFIHFINYVW
jgi:hypothetical protein